MSKTQDLEIADLETLDLNSVATFTVPDSNLRIANRDGARAA